MSTEPRTKKVARDKRIAAPKDLLGFSPIDGSHLFIIGKKELAAKNRKRR